MSLLCRELDQLWNEQVGEVVLFIWINFLEEQLLEFLDITSPLNLKNVVENTTKITKKHRRNVECRKNELDMFEELPPPIPVPQSWPMCSKIYNSRCEIYTPSIPVKNSNDTYTAVGSNEKHTNTIIASDGISQLFPSTPMPVPVSQTWPMCSKIYNSRCEIYTPSSPVKNIKASRPNVTINGKHKSAIMPPSVGLDQVPASIMAPSTDTIPADSPSWDYRNPVMNTKSSRPNVTINGKHKSTIMPSSVGLDQVPASIMAPSTDTIPADSPLWDYPNPPKNTKDSRSAVNINGMHTGTTMPPSVGLDQEPASTPPASTDIIPADSPLWDYPNPEKNTKDSRSAVSINGMHNGATMPSSVSLRQALTKTLAPSTDTIPADSPSWDYPNPVMNTKDSRSNVTINGKHKSTIMPPSMGLDQVPASIMAPSTDTIPADSPLWDYPNPAKNTKDSRSAVSINGMHNGTTMPPSVGLDQEPATTPPPSTDIIPANSPLWDYPNPEKNTKDSRSAVSINGMHNGATMPSSVSLRQALTKTLAPSTDTIPADSPSWDYPNPVMNTKDSRSNVTINGKHKSTIMPPSMGLDQVQASIMAPSTDTIPADSPLWDYPNPAKNTKDSRSAVSINGMHNGTTMPSSVSLRQALTKTLAPSTDTIPADSPLWDYPNPAKNTKDSPSAININGMHTGTTMPPSVGLDQEPATTLPPSTDTIPADSPLWDYPNPEKNTKDSRSAVSINGTTMPSSVSLHQASAMTISPSTDTIPADSPLWDYPNPSKNTKDSRSAVSINGMHNGTTIPSSVSLHQAPAMTILPSTDTIPADSPLWDYLSPVKNTNDSRSAVSINGMHNGTTIPSSVSLSHVPATTMATPFTKNPYKSTKQEFANTSHSPMKNTNVLDSSVHHDHTHIPSSESLDPLPLVVYPSATGGNDVSDKSQHSDNYGASGDNDNNINSDSNVIDVSCDCDKCLMSLHDDRVMRDITSEDVLLTVIMAHDKLRKEKMFKSTLFTCKVSKSTKTKWGMF